VPGEMTQEDLAPDDIMILDTWDQVNLYDACKKNALYKEYEI